MSEPLNIFFVGDIVGAPGLELATTLVPNYVKKYAVDLLIVNGENTTEGKGIAEEHARKLFDLGAHVITTGNHVWDRWDSRKVLGGDRRILRPLNYPRENGGNGYYIAELSGGRKAGVLNLQGRVFMQPIDDPFRTADWAVAKITEETKAIFVDFHADATAEKMAMGWHLDGKVSAVIGTHTHTPTADGRILPRGTAFQTDVGMTGPYDSVLGMKKDLAIKRLVTATPHKYEVASHDVRLCGVYVRVDAETGRALKMESVIFPAFG
ncbi:MAG TPA: TIGR00282 family metallophosphoesterase [Bacteroidota bacterium]|nr:TIGR00282 family metallophosphoesterase [Bacteroidota bacterium]